MRLTSGGQLLPPLPNRTDCDAHGIGNRLQAAEVLDYV